MKRSYLLNLRLYKYQINKLRLSGSSYICAQSLPKLELVTIDGLDYDVGMEELRRNNLGRENSFPDSELKTGFWGLESFFLYYLESLIKILFKVNYGFEEGGRFVEDLLDINFADLYSYSKKYRFDFDFENKFTKAWID